MTAKAADSKQNTSASPGAAKWRRVEHYRFSPDILARVRRCTTNDNYHGLIEVLENWLVIGVSIAVSLWAWNHLEIVYAVPIYLAAVFFIGGRQRALADILHQAAHGTLLKNRRLGNFIGKYLSGYLILQSFTSYTLSHVTYHHGRFGDPEKDPDYVHYQNSGICGENFNQKAIRRYLLYLLTPIAPIDYVLYLLRNRIIPRGEAPREQVVRGLFIAVVIAAFIYTGLAYELLLYWFVPLATTQVLIGALIELAEHYPMIELEPKVDIYMSRNRHCSRWSNALLGIQQSEGYHLIHHKFPLVPPWRHEEVHRILMEDENYRDVNQAHGWWPIFREILAANEAKLGRVPVAAQGA